MQLQQSLASIGFMHLIFMIFISESSLKKHQQVKTTTPQLFKKKFFMSSNDQLSLCVFSAHLLLINLSFWSPLCLITCLVPRRAQHTVVDAKDRRIPWQKSHPNTTTTTKLI